MYEFLVLEYLKRSYMDKAYSMEIDCRQNLRFRTSLVGVHPYNPVIKVIKYCGVVGASPYLETSVVTSPYFGTHTRPCLLETSLYIDHEREVP